MEIDVKHACSFTGHRPERLEMSEDKVIVWLDEQIRKAVEDGYSDFILIIKNAIDLSVDPVIRYDYSEHYKCYKDKR